MHHSYLLCNASRDCVNLHACAQAFDHDTKTVWLVHEMARHTSFIEFDFGRVATLTAMRWQHANRASAVSCKQKCVAPYGNRCFGYRTFAVPQFKVISGPCTLHQQGQCVGYMQHDDNTDGSVSCHIETTQPLALSACPMFEADQTLTMRAPYWQRQYAGCPSGLNLPNKTSIEWTQRDGASSWEIC
eukprot:COSAG01_NODE_27782_length_677_cov_0.785467_1_plen_186_part_01